MLHLYEIGWNTQFWGPEMKKDRKGFTNLQEDWEDVPASAVEKMLMDMQKLKKRPQRALVMGKRDLHML